MQLKVVWHEGLFMQPHHLQQQERYLEGYTWSLIREIAPLSYVSRFWMLMKFNWERASSVLNKPMG